MVDFLKKVEAVVVSRRLLMPRQRVLVAVSGGADSMVLLHLLAELGRKHAWKIVVAHLNHRLRGHSSAADERLVCRTAKELNLPVAVKRVDVRSFARKRKLSLEMAARKLRHDFLASTAARKGIPCIAMAHHRDDQAELFFLRLLRGSGSQGLGGMRWSNPSPSNPNVALIRPLLGFCKNQLLEYARWREIAFRDDASNDSLDILRNRIRHELLPLLEEKYQPGLRNNIVRAMDVLSAESDLVDGMATAWLRAHLEKKHADIGAGKARRKPAPEIKGNVFAPDRLIATRFESLPPAIQRRCIQLQLIQTGVVPEFDLVERLRLHPQTITEVRRLGRKGCAESNSGSEKIQPLRLFRSLSGVLVAAPAEKDEFTAGSLTVDLRKHGGRLEWGGVGIAWKIAEKNGKARPEQKQGREYFDAEAVGPMVKLRYWQPGDRFQPIGMDQPVKLQDLFVNQKVPQRRRRELIVATTCEGEVFWVEGLRISERFKLTEQTIRRLHWAWQRL